VTPGAGVHGRPVDVECARCLAEESLLKGIGVETVGIDAGAAGEFDSPLPLHHYLLGAAWLIAGSHTTLYPRLKRIVGGVDVGPNSADRKLAVQRTC
jgi:hypothetical protein